jgi:hypothetical protein
MAVNRLNVGATNQLLAKASTGQSTNILELQNTAGVTVAGVDASGNGVGGLAHPPTFKNLLINGAMQVAQRGTSVTGISSTGGTYNTADRQQMYIDTAGTWTQSVENDAPTGSGFRKSLKMLCTTANASLSAGSLLQVRQWIEGQNLQQVKKGTASAEQLTLSFWVKSNVTGTYIVSPFDNDNTRIVSKSYTINASDVWEYKTITFPADTTGVFDNDNGGSLLIRFILAAGTTYTSGTLQTTWGTNTAANAAVGQTNLAAATDNYWQITGVQLEVGSTATEFEFKPIDVELAQCQRYFIRYSRVDTTNGIDVDGSYPIAQAYGAGSIFGKIFFFPVIMRVAPDLTLSAAGHIRPTSSGGSSLAVFTSLTLNSKKDSVSINSSSGSSSLTAGHASAVDFLSSFDLKVSAEL